MQKWAKDFIDVTRNKVVEQVAQLSTINGDYDKAKAIDYASKHFNSRIKEIYAEMQKDGKESDFFNSASTGSISTLTKHVVMVSWTHACLSFAKEIYGYAKN